MSEEAGKGQTVADAAGEAIALARVQERVASKLSQEPPRYTPEGVNIVGNRWVVKLEFAETLLIAGVSSNRNARAVVDVPLAVISLSWPLAKAVSKLLGAVVADYEKEHGELHLPKDFSDQQPDT